MMSRRRFLQNSLPPLILFSSLLVIYLRTLAPGLSWANGGKDGGDLITAAATGGVAHPTGYPLYLLLARLFQSLPFGSLAFRTNLMSAIFAALAAVLIYQMVRRAQQSSMLSGLAAGYAFGLAPLVWSQAVITEVYALQAFLLALILYLYITPRPVSPFAQKTLDRWRGLALGLATANHVTAILIIPVALVSGCIYYKVDSLGDPKKAWYQNFTLDRGALLRQLGMLGAGLCLYLILPLRALANPPINWGNAVRLERFWWLVSAGVYQSYYLGLDLPDVWERMHTWAGLLIRQFGLPGLVLGLMGLVVFGTRSRLFLLTGWLAAVSLIFALFYRAEDSQVYLVPALLSFAIWIGLGVEGLLQLLSRQSPYVQWGMGLILVAYFIGTSMTNISEVDASHDSQAESFGRDVLAAAPENGIVFAEGDEAVFTLWYFHFALGERPDLTVVAVDLLHFDWYQETLRARYPSLVVPGPFPWPSTLIDANPSRQVCYVQYSNRVEMNCSP